MAQARAHIKPSKRAWLVATSVLVVLVLVEIGLRCTLGLGSPPLLRADRDIGYLFAPGQDLRRFGNHIHINRWSQRSVDATDTPSRARSRVLVVGDSVSWGGVQLDQSETWPELLSTRLTHQLGRPIEVLNASAGSWGVGNELAYLQRFGTFGSSVVILQIGSHDLLQAKSNSERVGRDPEMPDRRPTTAIGELLSRFVKRRLWPSKPSTAPTIANAELFEQNMFWLSQEIDYIHATGARSVVLHTPDRFEVVAKLTADPQEPWRGRFLSLVDSRGCAVVDLTKKWAGQPGTNEYFRDSVHPNARGARVIADELEPVILPLLR